jgi:hypothetical protein
MFPATDSITNEPTLSDFCRAWYTKFLLAAGESPLPLDPGERYRFTWLRTFDNPIICRIEIGRSAGTIVGKRLSGQGGFDPGVLASEQSHHLTNSESDELLGFLRQVIFWSPAPESHGGCDGAQWILEGVRAGQFHLWDQWSPIDRGERLAPFVEFGLCCVALAGFSVAGENIY